MRQDHYECALLLITRGSRLDVANNQGQLPAHCIDEDKSKAAGLIQLGTTLQKLMSERKAKFLAEKTVSSDISNGKETIPITAINGEDFENGPSGYVYVKNNVITNPLPIDRNIAKLQHCKCKDNCTSEETCKCADNSLRSWYDSNGVLKDGFDFHDPPMIFECNDMCSCNINSCNNRVVQHGITARMQVYKTYGMGWGVKSLVDIPKGGFVCEYVGELISDAEAEQRENDSYLFDLENRDGDTFCIDANKFGNVTRFINHSCDPNLVPVKVFTSHQDLRFPHIAMFASRDIKRGDVLGFDYGEKFWVIKHKFFTCWCGLEKCKYSKTAIGRTLDSYYKKNGLNACQEEEQEQKKQTGRLKLKLKMEEGKVVKVDDSLLLPDEPSKKKEHRRSSADSVKSNGNSQESKKTKKVVNGSNELKKIILYKKSVKDELVDSADSDSSRKSDRNHKKTKEKSVEKEKAIFSLKEKISEIQGQIMEIENKKQDKSVKQKEKSLEPSDSVINEKENIHETVKEESMEKPEAISEMVQDEITEEPISSDEVAKEVVDNVVSDSVLDSIVSDSVGQEISKELVSSELKKESAQVEENGNNDEGGEKCENNETLENGENDEKVQDAEESEKDEIDENIVEFETSEKDEIVEKVGIGEELEKLEEVRKDEICENGDDLFKHDLKTGAQVENKTLNENSESPQVNNNQCPKCYIIIKRPIKLKKHSRFCKGKSMKNGISKDIKIEKPQIAITNVDENTIEDVVDSKKLDEVKNGDLSPKTESPVPDSNEETPKRRTGRPKKPMVDVNNIMEKLPSNASHLKRSSSTSLRSSSSTPNSETVNSQSSESSETKESSGRPKRSRKTVDKDL